MAEQDEVVQIRVSVDDQASEQLAAISEQLVHLREAGAKTAQGVAAVPAHMREGMQALTGAIRQAGFIGGIVGGVTSEVVVQLGKLGAELIHRATDFRGLAESMRDLETHARGVGQSMTGYQGLQRQLQLGGMSAKEAQGTISQLSDLNLELQRYGAQNAPTTHRLLADVADPATFQYISKFMQQMEGAPVAKQIDLISGALENMRRTMTARGEAGGVEAAQRQFLQRLGLTPEAFAKIEEATQISEKLKKELAAEDPKRERMLQRRAEETEKFNRESLETSFIWKDIGDTLAASVLHGLGLNDAMSQLNTWMKRILVDAEAFERTWRDVDFSHALEQLGKMEPAIKPFTDELHTFIYTDLPELDRSFKSIIQWWKDNTKAAREPDIGSKIQRHEMEQRGWSDEQIDEYFKKHPVPPNAPKPYTVDDWRQLFGMKPREVTPQPGAADQFFGKQFGPRTGVPQSEIDEYERTHPSGGTTTTPPPPPPPPPPPSPTELTPEQQDRLQRRYRRGGQRQSYEEGAGQPIIVPASMVAGGQEAQATGQRISPDMMQALIKSGQGEAGGGQSSGGLDGIHPIGFKSNLAAKVAEHIGEELLTPGHMLKTGSELYEMAKTGEDVAKAQSSGIQLPKMPSIAEIILSALPLGLGAIPTMMQKDLAEGSPRRTWLREKLGIEDPHEEAGPWGGGEKDERSTFDKRFGAWPDQQPAPSAFENRFGVWPGMGADKLDETSAKLDQAANQNVNISGAGKIQVDVRAPPGTSVDAQGEGFFKSTEITRMTQMMPADFGPGPVTGVSAGQGVAANGTVGAA
jgi:hypothetical protein